MKVISIVINNYMYYLIEFKIELYYKLICLIIFFIIWQRVGKNPNN